MQQECPDGRQAGQEAAIAKETADKNRPTRPVGPYFLFCKKMRPKIIAANPTFNFGEVGKALGAAWKKTSDADKAMYTEWGVARSFGVD
jgi:hypothetical protein